MSQGFAGFVPPDSASITGRTSGVSSQEGGAGCRVWWMRAEGAWGDPGGCAQAHVARKCSGTGCTVLVEQGLRAALGKRSLAGRVLLTGPPPIARAVRARNGTTPPRPARARIPAEGVGYRVFGVASAPLQEATGRPNNNPAFQTAFQEKFKIPWQCDRPK